MKTLKFEKSICLLIFLIIGLNSSGQMTEQLSVPRTQGNYILKTTDAIVTIADSAGDVILTKMDTMCNVLWIKIIGQQGKEEFGYCLDQTFDGGFIIYGASNRSSIDPHAWLVWLDSVGNEIRDTTYLNPFFSNSTGTYCSVVDSNRIFLNYIEPHHLAPGKVYVRMVSGNGSILWNTLILDSAGTNTANNYVQVYDGFLMVNTIFVSGNAFNITKVDSIGQIVFKNRYDNLLNLRNKQILSIKPTNDSSYLITGGSQDDVTNENVYIYGKTNGLGNLLWFKKLHFNLSIWDRIVSSQTLVDSTCILLAEKATDNSVLLKINYSGDTLWTKLYSPEFHFRSIQKLNEERYCVIGEYTDSSTAQISIVYQELDRHGEPSNCMYVSMDEIQSNFENGLVLFPNPARNQFRVRINIPQSGQYEWKLSSVEGKIIKCGILEAISNGFHEFEISDINQAGVLIFSIRINNRILNRKFIISDF